MTTLKKLRTEQGLTQDEIARIVGLTSRRYRDYESGKCPRSVAAVLKIARQLGTTVEELFGQAL